MKIYFYFTFIFFIVSIECWGQSCSCSGVPVLTVGTAGASCSSVQQTGNIKSCSETTTICPTDVSTTRRGYYQFTATATTHTLSVTGSGGFDAILSVGTTCGTGDILSCLDNSDIGETETSTLISLTIGNTYYVAVRNYFSVNNNNSNNSFTICVTTPSSPPANDNCSAAVSLTHFANGTCTTTNSTLAGATQSLAGCTGTADDDVWFQFTATSTSADVRVGNNTIDEVVEIFSGACGGLTSLICQDTPEGSVIISGLTIGQVYRVRVYSWANTAPSSPTFNICVTTPPASPPNDDCVGAITITQQTVGNCTLTSGSVLGATQTTPACTGSGTADVWYSFVTTNTTAIIRRTASFDSVLQVMSACGSGSLGCFDNESDQTITGLTIGTTYFYRIMPFSSSAPANPNFTTCVTSPCTTATNDACTTAITLTHQPRNACTDYTSCLTGATQSQATCTGSMTANDVWFRFVATKDSAIIHRVANFNNIIQAFSGACGSLTSLNCYYPSGSSGQQADLLLTGLTVGQTYTFRLYADISTIPSQPSFSVCVTSPTNVNNTTCGNMNPICTSTTVTFQAQTGGTSESGNNYGCLFSQPNPTWFYLQIGTSGNLNFTVSASADVDYALWGPYTTLPLAKSACGSLPTPVSCSYSTAKVENINIASGTTGQVYVLLVTNFANRLQIINLLQTGGSGTSDCAILLPVFLSSWNGIKQKDENILLWKANENNELKSFEIEHSINGIDFKKIATIEKNPQKNEYQYAHKNYVCGENYYRLKSIGEQNMADISPIIHLKRNNNECNAVVEVYPNPFTKEINIEIFDKNTQSFAYQIEDMYGKVIKNGHLKVENQKTSLELNELSDGVFMLSTWINGQKYFKKIVKN